MGTGRGEGEREKAAASSSARATYLPDWVRYAARVVGSATAPSACSAVAALICARAQGQHVRRANQQFGVFLVWVSPNYRRLASSSYLQPDNAFQKKRCSQRCLPTPLRSPASGECARVPVTKVNALVDIPGKRPRPCAGKLARAIATAALSRPGQCEDWRVWPLVNLRVCMGIIITL